MRVGGSEVSRISGDRRAALRGQRVAIARALINSPAVVLGDEPTGEVDSETSAQLVGLMREVNRERGVTFVIVTHDLAVAACADRVVRMQDGRVVTEVAGATTPAVAAAD